MPKLVKEENMKKIIATLKEHGELNLTEIWKKSGVPIASVYNYINNGLADKVILVREFGTKKKAVTKIYRLKR